MKEVDELVLVFDLDLLQYALVHVLGDDCEVAVSEALDSGCSRLVIDEGQLSKGLTQCQLHYLAEM